MPPGDEFLISPITGEKIPASKMQEHMRIGLLDPRWLEQRDRNLRERQIEEEVYAPGLDIESSLKQLAERRTDIFGVEETAIGKKIGEEEIQKPEEKVSDGGLTVNFYNLFCTLFILNPVCACVGDVGRSLRQHGAYAAGRSGEHHAAGADRSHPQS